MSEIPEPQAESASPLQGPNREYLQKALRVELLKQQDVVYGIVGGLAAALVGAVIWAAITVATGKQIGYMAIGVGLLAGFAVRFFGGGVGLSFGAIGAFFALLGCLLGNLLSQVGFVANNEGVGYFEIIGRLNFSIIVSLFQETFSPMDVVFYGIAAYEGFRFGFRQIDVELDRAVAAGRVPPLPFGQFRLPVVIVLFVGLCVIGYLVTTAGDGVRNYKYASGALQASGQMNGSREEGAWEYWWENGQKQATGSYVNGNPDGEWIYYNEDGTVSSKGLHKIGLKEGDWTQFYSDGSVSSKGLYAFGRQSGQWQFTYATGKPMSHGAFVVDLNDGEWEYFHENGNPLSKGTYKLGEYTGVWTQWYENGNKKSEIEYFEGYSKILNTWNEDGKPVIVSGSGLLKVFDGDGNVVESGMIKGGLRDGVWNQFFADGKKKQEGEYKGMVYYIKNAWNETGDQELSNGTGDLEEILADGSRMTGRFVDGLRTDVWKTYYFDSEQVAAELTYKNGKLEGLNKNYDATGYVNVEGSFANDKRDGAWKWYSADGVVESEVTYVNGKKEGEQKFYNSYGDLLKVEIYKDGSLVTTNVVG